MLETLDHAIRIGSTPTFLYLNYIHWWTIAGNFKTRHDLSINIARFLHMLFVICFDISGKMEQIILSRDPQGQWTDNADIGL